MQQNAVGWFEIYVSDLDRAKSFYEGVLATTLTKLEDPTGETEMWSFPQADGYGAGGAIVKMNGMTAGAGGTIVYFSTEDCGVEEARIAEHGGVVVQSKKDIGEYGFMVLAKDPEGNVIGFHSQK